MSLHLTPEKESCCQHGSSIDCPANLRIRELETERPLCHCPNCPKDCCSTCDEEGCDECAIRREKALTNQLEDANAEADRFLEKNRILSSRIRPSYFEDVREFHHIWHDPPLLPVTIGDKEWTHRTRLILEELAETARDYALGKEDGFADGLVDLTWVVLGTAVVAGLPFDALWDEVKRTNMAKRGGTIDRSGKLTKPPGWAGPDIARILREAREEHA